MVLMRQRERLGIVQHVPARGGQRDLPSHGDILVADIL